MLVLLIYERLERHFDVAGGEFFSAIGRVAFGKEEAQRERAPARLGILDVAHTTDGGDIQPCAVGDILECHRS